MRSSSNRQAELYAAAIIPYTAAAVALVLRLASRRRTRTPQLLWEDYLAVVAFVIGSGFTFISLYKMRWGLGIHLKDIQLPEAQILRHYFLDLWADMWMYTFSVGLSKFVLLGFYWRTFGLSVLRQPIRVLFVCSACWIIVRVTLITLQCQPIRKFWNPNVPGKCLLTPMISLFGTGIPHLIIELAILLCPIIEIWRLHLPLGRKIAVGAMFASGILVCGSALGTVIHTLALAGKPNKDLTWDGLDDQIWAVCDVNLASFSTSLPLLRPVFRPLLHAWSELLCSFVSSHDGYDDNHDNNHNNNNNDTNTNTNTNHTKDKNKNKNKKNKNIFHSKPYIQNSGSRKWRANSKSLSSSLLNGREVLTVGSAPMKRGRRGGWEEEEEGEEEGDVEMEGNVDVVEMDVDLHVSIRRGEGSDIP